MRRIAKSSDAEIVAEGFHFCNGVLVSGAVGGGDAVVETVEGFVGAAKSGEGLRGHLVGGDVVGVVLDEGGELVSEGPDMARALSPRPTAFGTRPGGDLDL